MEFVQGVINRLSQNSFLLKGWSVVLVSALLALAAGNSQLVFVLLAYIPVFVFWGLDGYYLLKERKFRDLYNDVRVLKEDDIDFSMSVEEYNSRSWLGSIFSKTIAPFHGSLLAILIFINWFGLGN